MKRVIMIWNELMNWIPTYTEMIMIVILLSIVWLAWGQFQF
jgi:hypothetical protein